MTLAQIKKNIKDGDYSILQKLLRLSTESAARQKFLRGDKDALEGMIKIQENRSIFCDLHADEDCSCHEDLKEAINQKADINHTHDWNEITGKPTEFPPTHHLHDVRDIEGLDDVLHTIDEIRNISNQKLDKDGSNATGSLASTINNNHNHVNKAVLDTITASKVNDWDNAAGKAHNAVTLGSNATGLTITNQVLQFSNGYQLPTTIKISEWDDAYLKRHTHGNKAVLDNLTQSVIDQSHAHSNKSVIDGITAQMINNWNASFANNHTHNNKVILDGISSADVTNWDTAHANNHSHTNKVILDAITAAYTAAEKNKLATIQPNAQVNVKADWNATSGDAEILNKPTSFTPSSHNHAISDVAGLQSELDSKLEANDLDGFVYNVAYNSSLHTLTFYQRNEPNIVIDLPIEHLIKGVQLHGNDLVFTFEDGSNVTVPMNTLLVGVVKSVNGSTANSQGEIVLDISDIPGLLNILSGKADSSGYYPNLHVGQADNSEKWNDLSFDDTFVNTGTYFMTSSGGGIWRYTDISSMQNLLGISTVLNLNLQQVTNNGSTTTNPIIIQNTSYDSYSIWSNQDFRFLTNQGEALKILTGGVLISNSYGDAGLIPTNGIYSKGIIQTLSNGNSTLWNDAYNKGFINWGYFGNYFGDYNDATKEGRYIMWSDAVQQSIPNRPSDYSGVLEVTWSDATNWCFQRYQEYGGDQSTYTRRFYNGAWSTWVKLLSSNNSDLTQFVKKTGDTMQGSLMFPNNEPINFGNNASFGVKYDPTYNGLNFVRWGYTDGVLFIGDNERIGIGTTSPQTKLHTVGNNYTEGYAGSMYGHTIMQTTGTGHGLSLYGTQVDQGYNPEYGLMFATTGNYGTMGSVSGDWATYFTMAGASNRGWIFRHQGIGNVASINGEGVISTMYHGNSSQWQSAWVNGLVNRGDIYTSNIDFNNLPIENRIAGIHTGNGSGNTNLPGYMNGSYGIHTRTVGGAFTTDTVYGNGGEMWYKTWYHPSGANGTDWRKVWDNVNLSDPATENWVNNNFVSNVQLGQYLPLSGGTLTGGGVIDSQGNLILQQAPTMNATGMFWKNLADTNNICGIGSLTNGDILHEVYMGWGDYPWDRSSNFSVSINHIQYKGQDLWHAGNLADPATETWVHNKGYITASALNGYASQSWVNSQGFLTSASLPNVSNATITYQGTGAITGGGSHTINQSGNSAYNFDLTNQTKNEISLGVNAYNSLSSKQDTLVAGNGISIVGNTISATNSGGGSGIERIFTDNSSQSGPADEQSGVIFTSHEAYGLPQAEYKHEGNATIAIEDSKTLHLFSSYDSVHTIQTSGNNVHIDIDSIRAHIYNVVKFQAGSNHISVSFPNGIYAGDQINISAQRGTMIYINTPNLISSVGAEIPSHANLVWDSGSQAWVVKSFGY